jgi:hypothetical protein
LIGDTASWGAQVADCASTGSSAVYLGVPGDAAELAAMVELNDGNKIWLGIDDRVTEGSFVDGSGVAAPYLPWKSGAPDANPDNDKDCVATDSATQIFDDACGATYEAVCECEEE